MQVLKYVRFIAKVFFRKVTPVYWSLNPRLCRRKIFTKPNALCYALFKNWKRQIINELFLAAYMYYLLITRLSSSPCPRAEVSLWHTKSFAWLISRSATIFLLLGLQLVLLTEFFLRINQSALSTADFVPNTSDEEQRYSYKNQPNVGFFNLEKLLLAMKPLLEDYSA